METNDKTSTIPGSTTTTSSAATKAKVGENTASSSTASKIDTATSHHMTSTSNFVNNNVTTHNGYTKVSKQIDSTTVTTDDPATLDVGLVIGISVVIIAVICVTGAVLLYVMKKKSAQVMASDKYTVSA